MPKAKAAEKAPKAPKCWRDGTTLHQDRGLWFCESCGHAQH